MLPGMHDHRQNQGWKLQLIDGGGVDLPDAELGRLVGRAEQLGRSVVLCEAEVGSELPAYGERCRWRSRMVEGGADHVLLFTDAARISHVWSWVEMPGLSWAEFRLPKRVRALEASFRRLEGASGGGASGLDAEAADEVARAVLRRCRGVEVGRMNLEGLVRLITGSNDVLSLRRIWKAVRSIRILDPDCDSPAWISARASPLELIYIAALERMRGWVDDLDRGPKRRPEHLRDFKELVEAAEGERWGADRARWVRWEILRRNLFALHRSGIGQERFHGWAREWAGSIAAEHLPLVANSSLGGAAGGPPPNRIRGGALQETDLLRRSMQAARDAFGTLEWTHAEHARAAEQLEQRRVLLLQLYESRGPAAPADFPLDLCFPILEAGEHLDLIRAH